MATLTRQERIALVRVIAALAAQTIGWRTDTRARYTDTISSRRKTVEVVFTLRGNDRKYTYLLDNDGTLYGPGPISRPIILENSSDDVLIAVEAALRELPPKPSSP